MQRLQITILIIYLTIAINVQPSDGGNGCDLVDMPSAPYYAYDCTNVPTSNLLSFLSDQPLFRSYNVCTFHTYQGQIRNSQQESVFVVDQTLHINGWSDVFFDGNRCTKGSKTYQWYCSVLGLNSIISSVPSITTFSVCNMTITYSSASTSGSSSSDGMTCLDVMIDLEGGGTATSPVSVLRRQNVGIVPNIKHQCNFTTHFQYTWVVCGGQSSGVASASSTCEDPSNLSGVRDLSLTPGQLPYGINMLQLVVNLTISLDSGITVVSGHTKQTWLQVEQSDLVAVISGGSARRIGQFEEVNLIGSSSYDPDGELSAEDLDFEWYCYIRGDEQDELEYADLLASRSSVAISGCQGQGYALPYSTSDVEDVSLTPSALPVTYTFILRVGLPMRGYFNTSQDVTLVDGSPPLVGINCIQNCGQYVNPSQKLALEAVCSNCVAGDPLIYGWYFNSRTPNSQRSNINWSTETSTGNSQHLLVILANTFSAETEETYDILVNVTQADGELGQAAFTIKINAAPTLGTCSIQPVEGRVLQTKFTITCSGFEDTDTPLKYRFLTSRANNLALLQYGFSSQTPDIFLPLGNESNGFQLDIVVEVEDCFGAKQRATAQVKVEEAELAITNVNNLEGSDGTSLGDLVAQGDVQAATVLMSTVSSIVNKQSTDAEKKNERTEIRKTIIDNVASMNFSSLESLQQTTGLLSEVTQVTDELSDEAEQTSANTLLDIASSLEETFLTAGEEGVKEIVTCMAQTVSNILHSTSISEQETDTVEVQRATTLVCLSALTLINKVMMAGKLAGEEATVLRADRIVIQLEKSTPDNLKAATFGVRTTSASTVTNEISLPSNLDLSAEVTSGDVGVEIVQFTGNPYSWSTTSDRVSTSVSDFNLRHSGNVLNISDLSEPVEIFIPQQSSTKDQGGVLSIASGQPLFVNFQINRNDSAALLFLRRGGDITDGSIDVTVTQVDPASVNITFNDELLETWKVRATHSIQRLEVSEAPLMLTPEQLMGPGSYVARMAVAGDTGLFIQDLSVSIIEASCLYWDGDKELWTGSGCQVGNKTKESFIHCTCNHLTSFAGGLLVPPNNLDILKALAQFLKFWQNPVVLSLVVIFLLIYAVLAVWARRADRNYYIQIKPIDLEDNHLLAQYPYAVTIYTGRRRGAETTATVGIMIIGDKGRSSAHVLKSNEYEVFQQNSNDLFVLRTRESLGKIVAVHLWHNNEGEGPNWYVSRVLVQDMTEGTIFHFACHCWLSALPKEGCDRTFPVTEPEAVHNYQRRFLEMANTGIKDDHTFVSVYTCPVRSPFTRLQRLSVCLAILFTEMLTSIMFYKDIDDDSQKRSMDVGPISFPRDEIIIGIETALLVLPLDILVVKFFMESQGLPKNYAYFSAIQKTFEAFQRVLAAASICGIRSNGRGTQEEPIIDEHKVNFNTEEDPPLYDEYIVGKKILKSISIRQYQEHGLCPVRRQSIKSSEQVDESCKDSNEGIPKSVDEVSSEIMEVESNDLIQEKTTLKIDDLNQESSGTILSSISFPSEDILMLLGEENDPSSTDPLQHNQSSKSSISVGKSEEIVKNNSSQKNMNQSTNPPDNELRVETNKNTSDLGEMTLEVENELLMMRSRRYYNRKVRYLCRRLGMSPCMKKTLLIIAWVVLVLMVALSAFFTVLYSFEYGLYVSVKWLRSTLFALTLEVGIVMPIKALLLAALLSYFLKKPSDDLELNAVKVWQPDFLPTLDAALVAEADTKWEGERQHPSYVPLKNSSYNVFML